jgi:hypothetical protein
MIANIKIVVDMCKKKCYNYFVKERTSEFMVSPKKD